MHRLRQPLPCEHRRDGGDRGGRRSEEHTSELQSRQYLVCRLLLEKKITPPQHHRISQDSARSLCQLRQDAAETIDALIFSPERCANSLAILAQVSVSVPEVGIAIL